MKRKKIIDRECYFCGSPYTELHHIFGGAYKKASEQYGFVVDLCYEHHRGDHGVHFNKELREQLRRECQERFEEEHTREEFRAIFGKSYL